MSNNVYSPKTVTIVGYGRFGKVLYRLLKDDFQVTIYSRTGNLDPVQINGNTQVTCDLDVAYQSDVVFLAVPIESFEEVVARHWSHFRPDQLLIDVLSVKSWPKQILARDLAATQTRALLTHPMFGPDSSQAGWQGLPMIMDQFLATDQEYRWWRKYFANKGLRIVELDADQHDKLAAKSQGLTHFLGRVLEKMELESTVIDSLGATKLQEIKAQTCNDTWQLFTNLQQYNPYTAQMRQDLGMAFDDLFKELVVKVPRPDQPLRVGIQGGKGSYNEEAALAYFKQRGIYDFELVYLHTSDRVMKAIKAGEIDLGQMAVHNSVGGMVQESLESMAQFRFEIVAQFEITISHTLMIHPEANWSDITSIMTHPQVLAQCKGNLARKYSDMELTSGEGELVDHALVAEALSKGELPKNVAVMGSKVLADLYGLQIIDRDLQDAETNLTSFIQVR